MHYYISAKKQLHYYMGKLIFCLEAPNYIKRWGQVYFYDRYQFKLQITNYKSWINCTVVWSLQPFFTFWSFTFGIANTWEKKWFMTSFIQRGLLRSDSWATIFLFYIYIWATIFLLYIYIMKIAVILLSGVILCFHWCLLTCQMSFFFF